MKTNHGIYALTLVLAAGIAPEASAASPAEEPKYNHAPVTLWLVPQLGTAGLSSDEIKTNFALSLGASAYARLEGVDVGAGASWVTDSVRGAQITAGFNYAGRDAIGLQLSAGLNYAPEVTGAQISLINFGGKIEGAQLGLINIADVVHGTQIGLLNIANDSRTPLGLFNLIDNGQHHVSLWSSDSAPLNLGIKLGGETIYTLLSAGFETSNGQKRWLAGFGVGGHFPIDDRFYLDAELLTSHVNENAAWTDDLNMLTSLRALFGWELARRFSIFGGPTLNVMVSEGDRGFGLFRGFRLNSEQSETSVRMWPGFVAGFQI
jgi:hypothetical protein